MNTCIFIDKFDAFTTKYLKKLLAELSDEISTIVSWQEIPKEIREIYNLEFVIYDNSYLINSASPKMYSLFFSMLQNRNFERVIAPRIHFPEYFVLEILSRNLLQAFSVGFFGLSELLGSPSREYLIAKFLNQNVANKVILHTIYYQIDDFEHNIHLKNLLSQICIVSDPIYESPQDYNVPNRSRDYATFNVPTNSIVVTFFGSMFFGKGLDILLKAFDFLSDNYFLIIASSTKTLNYELDKDKLKGERILHLDRFIHEDEVPQIFCASDLLVLPYRNTYINSTSGVIVQASLAGKPVLVPDIRPFGDVVSRFKTGYTFKVEDHVDLARAIVDSDWGSVKRENHDIFLKSFDSWSWIAEKYMARGP